LQSDQTLPGFLVARQSRWAAAVVDRQLVRGAGSYRLTSAARARAQQQTRSTSLLLSLDGDSQTTAATCGGLAAECGRAQQMTIDSCRSRASEVV